jgi:hypothetical protein
MTANEAQKMGIAAYMAGKTCPAHDRQFLNAVAGTGRFIELAAAWNHGRTIAMLAAGAPPEMPSVKRLMEILAA